MADITIQAGNTTTVSGILNINDKTKYLVEDVQYRSMPQRELTTGKIAIRPGEKLTSSEFSTKEITIKGYIFGNDPNDLRNNIDEFQKLAGLQTVALTIDERTYTTTLTRMNLPQQYYNNTMQPYEATFKALQPFSFSSLLLVSGIAPSGIATISGTLVVSGTVFAEPSILVRPIGNSSGNTGISSIKVKYLSTNQELVVSGGNYQYQRDVIFDFSNYIITSSGNNTDFAGFFARWEPGARQFTITISGGKPGFIYQLFYNPRYFQ
jgi:hypothetical protein